MEWGCCGFGGGGDGEEEGWWKKGVGGGGGRWVCAYVKFKGVFLQVALVGNMQVFGEALAYLQGFMELFNDAYQLLIKMFKRKNVPIEKWLPLMWESRSLSHALCVSPVNEEFIMNSMDEFSELSNIDFWIRYLQGNQSSLIGFRRSNFC